MSPGPGIDVVHHCAAWRRAVPQVGRVCRRAASAAWAVAGGPPGDAEVAVVLSDDCEVRDLNARYRGLDRPTNVLSFPYAAPQGGRTAAAAAPAALLGDIVVAFETAAAEAADQDRALSDHLSRLVVHGMLHLLGFDHADEEGAAAMDTLEAKTLERLGIAEPDAPLLVTTDHADHS